MCCCAASVSPALLKACHRRLACSASNTARSASVSVGPTSHVRNLRCASSSEAYLLSVSFTISCGVSASSQSTCTERSGSDGSSDWLMEGDVDRCGEAVRIRAKYRSTNGLPVMTVGGAVKLSVGGTLDEGCSVSGEGEASGGRLTSEVRARRARGGCLLL